MRRRLSTLSNSLWNLGWWMLIVLSLKGTTHQSYNTCIKHSKESLAGVTPHGRGVAFLIENIFHFIYREVNQAAYFCARTALEHSFTRRNTHQDNLTSKLFTCFEGDANFVDSDYLAFVLILKEDLAFCIQP